MNMKTNFRFNLSSQKIYCIISTSKIIMENVCILESYILSLLEFLTGTKENDVTIIRRHSRKLEQLGEISFPLSIKNWYHLIQSDKINRNNIDNILQYNVRDNELSGQIVELKERCKCYEINIDNVEIKENDVHLYLRRTSSLYKTVITDVLHKNNMYGSNYIFKTKILTKCDCNIENKELSEIDLSTLRMLELKNVAANFLAFTSKNTNELGPQIKFTLNSSNKCQESVLCGPVLNGKGVKESRTTAQELFEKRTLDMRLMAQHRYKVQVIPNTPREDYFLKTVKRLGRACVTIEMLSNKPNKSLKVMLNDLRTANRGAAFIFYNCARLSVLLKEFDRRVAKGMYPSLPNASEIDFSVLNQPEEWELFYVYILQFPLVIKSCIKDILKNIFNPQYLVTFLSNLSSLFSAYYRRVRVLTDPREHLFGILHARIYLLKTLQVVFHNALSLLNIEPIKEM